SPFRPAPRAAGGVLDRLDVAQRFRVGLLARAHAGLLGETVVALVRLLPAHVGAAATVGVGVPVVALAAALLLGQPARGQPAQLGTLVGRVGEHGPEARRDGIV